MRDVPYNANLICDECGKRGAYDFMGDYLCPKCANIEKTERVIKCPRCGEPEPVLHCEQCGHNFTKRRS